MPFKIATGKNPGQILHLEIAAPRIPAMFAATVKTKRRPTIFDLSRITGLSRGTISRAFNNGGEINAATRELVLQKAAEIGYAPHPGARTIKSGRTGRLGVLMPNLCNPWYSELTEALDHVSRQRNCMLLLGLSHYNPKLEKDFIRYWAAGEADGMIVASTDTIDNFEEYSKVHERGFPVVFLYGSPNLAFDYVRFSVKENYERALRQLYSLGHRRIGYIGQDYFHARQNESFCAYTEFHEQHGLSVREEYIHFMANDYEAGPAAWLKWRSLPKAPTAVVCTGDVIACSLIQVVLSAGYRIPRDLSILGENDIAEAERLKLTTIRTDRMAFAAAAMELLERPRGEGQPQAITQVVPSQLILRDSVGPCPAD